MKITVEEWNRYFPTLSAEVLGNGKPVERVVAFDTEKATIERIMTDLKGNVLLSVDKKEVRTEILNFKHVTLRIKPRDSV